MAHAAAVSGMMNCRHTVSEAAFGVPGQPGAWVYQPMYGAK